MSSHHVVTDKQEPALIIANGESCNFEIMQELLEWSPTVMVLDGAIDRVLSLNIKVDIWLGDFDSSSEDYLPQDNLIKVSAPDQNKTDLEKGIEYLISQNHKSATILWATGRRADHNFANIVSIAKYRHQINLKIIDNYSVVFPLLEGPNGYEKWYLKNSNISLIPIPEAKGIFCENLVYPLNNFSLSLNGMLGNSNKVLNDGLVKIKYDSGCLLMMECHD